MAYAGFVVLVLVGLPSSAAAYRTLADELALELPVRHDGAAIEVLVRGGAVAGLSDTELEDAVTVAVESWRVDCMETGDSRASVPRLELGGFTASSPLDSDGRTTVSVVEEGWVSLGHEADQAAIAELRYVETEWGWAIVDADVFVNGDTIDWTADGAPDLAAVLTHELGHCLGLAHAAEPGCDEGLAARAIMCPDYQPEGQSPRADDIEGMCSVYSVPSEECVESCGPTEACLGGACRPATMCAEDCRERTCASAGPRAGECVSLGAEGASCMRGEDCASSLCLTSMQLGSYCTRSCVDDATCSDGQRCASVDGRSVCASRPQASCSISFAGSSATPPFALALCLVALVPRRRR